VEDVPELLRLLPELAPGVVLGVLAGIGYGFYEDHGQGELPVSWWHCSGVGAVLGAFAWLALMTLS
jgi:hypothetical protein